MSTDPCVPTSSPQARFGLEIRLKPAPGSSLSGQGGGGSDHAHMGNGFVHSERSVRLLRDKVIPGANARLPAGPAVTTATAAEWITNANRLDLPGIFPTHELMRGACQNRGNRHNPN